MAEDAATGAHRANSRQVRHDPANATANTMIVPVIRDPGFAHLRPDRLNIMRMSSTHAEKYELRLQSFVYRETSQRINLAPGGGLGVIGRDVCMEVLELGAVDLTLQQMQKLRDDLSREIAAASPSSSDFSPAPSPAHSPAWPLQVQPSGLDTRPELKRLEETRPSPPPDLVPSPSAPAPPETQPADALTAESTATGETSVGEARPGPAPAAIAGSHPLFDELHREPFPAKPKRSAVNDSIAAASLLLVVGGIGAVIWAAYPVLFGAPPSARPNAQPPVAQGQANDGAAPPANPSVATAAPTAGAPDAASSPDVPSSPAPAMAEAAPPAHPQAAASPPQAAAPSQPDVAAVAAPSPTPASPQPAAPHLAVTVRASCWIIVSDDSGKIYLEKLMKPGESWTVPPVQGLELRTGNAGATSLVVDGVTKPPLGADSALWTGPLEG